MGMDLARAAHAEALADIQPRPVRRPSLVPGVPDPFIPREATFGQLFANLSRAVRQSILLEARLAAGAYDHPYPAARPEHIEPAPHPAPQSPTAQAASRHRPRLSAERLEDDLAEHARRPAEDILTGICAELAEAASVGWLQPTQITA